MCPPSPPTVSPGACCSDPGEEGLGDPWCWCLGPCLLSTLDSSPSVTVPLAWSSRACTEMQPLSPRCISCLVR